jgi:hypothetical protein
MEVLLPGGHEVLPSRWCFANDEPSGFASRTTPVCLSSTVLARGPQGSHSLLGRLIPGYLVASAHPKFQRLKDGKNQATRIRGVSRG